MKKVKEVSKLTGISRRTLQYYDDEGLVPVKRSQENYRLYDETAMNRLWEILLYKEIGFKLKEIKEILDIPESERKKYLEKRIKMIQKKIHALEEQIQLILFVKESGILPIPDMDYVKEQTYVERMKAIVNECKRK